MWFIGLIGVALGFLLAEGSKYINHRLRIRKLNNTVNKELESILAQIPLKKDIANDMINSLKKKEGLKIELTELLNTLGFEKDCRQDSEEIKKGKGKKLLRKNLSCKIEKVMKKKKGLNIIAKIIVFKNGLPRPDYRQAGRLSY